LSKPEPDHPRRRRWWLLVPLVVMLVAATTAGSTDQGRTWFRDASRVLGIGPSPQSSSEPTESSSPSGGDSPVDTLLAPPEPPTVPTTSDSGSENIDPTRVEAAMRGGLAAPSLGKRVVAAVAPLAGGSSVFAVGSGAVRPASTMKLLTTTAALDTFGPEHTFETRVAIAGGQDGSTEGGTAARTLFLVGGGDPLLASRPSSDSYPPRADVSTLARLSAAALRADGVTRVRVRYDDSLFTGPVGSPSWRSDYLRDDIVAPITALWVDEGRPSQGFGRVDDPSAAAAQVFATALRRAGVGVVGSPAAGSATSDARDVASVQSPPLSRIVEHILEVSDNEAAEVLAHHVGVAATDDGSFAGGASGVAARLTALGIPLSGARIEDGSGLSRANRLRPETLVSVLQLASQPDHPELRAVITGLPVAAYTGSLAYRFADGPAAGRGRVRAKTGTLTGVHGLAGIATDADGQTYAFAVIADRVAAPRQLAARLAIDRLAAELAACRCAGPQ
jgi:serine-type D-Ala-D-Ala carboxypeptidase/endopeptidase (penicillin-binding protein 4)